MRLRDALDACSVGDAGDWVSLPGERPATAMAVGLFDSGASEPQTTILAPHSLAVYEPDARLSLVWPVPDDETRNRRGRADPEWLTGESHDWTLARSGWVVVLVNGAPVWQESVLYLDWGSGIGGYVPDFEPLYGDDHDLRGWETTTWAVGLARLINVFSSSVEFNDFDPTSRVVPSPSPVHPIDARRDLS